MLRLIDADALRLMKVEECAGHSIEYALGWKACIEYIKAAPTIDAIPVEWLRSQLKNNPNDIESAYDDICINELIDKWQKEQEAR